MNPIDAIALVLRKVSFILHRMAIIPRRFTVNGKLVAVLLMFREMRLIWEICFGNEGFIMIPDSRNCWANGAEELHPSGGCSLF